MRIFRSDEGGRAIEHFGSRAFTHTRLAVAGDAHRARLELGPGGLIGYHEGPVPQLLVVVAGSGWVRGEEGGRRPVEVGDAVFWSAGEGHETGTEGGLTALVLEAGSLELPP